MTRFQAQFERPPAASEAIEEGESVEPVVVGEPIVAEDAVTVPAATDPVETAAPATETHAPESAQPLIGAELSQPSAMSRAAPILLGIVGAAGAIFLLGLAVTLRRR
jgi:hypothetical protein